MSVALLIITHDQLGRQLLATATTMLEVCPLNAAALAISGDRDPDQMALEAQQALDRLDEGEGVLVLTDIYGSTPSNIAIRLLRDHRATVVAGINLPMLIRVLNYPSLTLEELAQKALSGGRDGIVLCREDPWR